VNATSYPRLRSSDATANWAALWVRCPDLLSLACSGLFVMRTVYQIYYNISRSAQEVQPGDIVDDDASLPPSAEQLIEAVMAANPTFTHDKAV
jgi:hypothetical protein